MERIELLYTRENGRSWITFGVEVPAGTSVALGNQHGNMISVPPFPPHAFPKLAVIIKLGIWSASAGQYLQDRRPDLTNAYTIERQASFGMPLRVVSKRST